MTEVYLALGSNVGKSKQYITQAITLLSTSIHDIRQAPLYISKATGYTDQADFVNTAVSGYTDLTPDMLLKFVKNIENKLGRIARFRWGPREIDIDIIMYGELVLDSPTLTIPHPRFRERDFVLQPLVDLAAETTDPVSHKTMRQLFGQLSLQQHAIIDEVDEEA